MLLLHGTRPWVQIGAWSLMSACLRVDVATKALIPHVGARPLIHPMRIKFYTNKLLQKDLPITKNYEKQSIMKAIGHRI